MTRDQKEVSFLQLLLQKNNFLKIIFFRLVSKWLTFIFVMFLFEMFWVECFRPEATISLLYLHLGRTHENASSSAASSVRRSGLYAQNAYGRLKSVCDPCFLVKTSLRLRGHPNMRSKLGFVQTELGKYAMFVRIVRMLLSKMWSTHKCVRTDESTKIHSCASQHLGPKSLYKLDV